MKKYFAEFTGTFALVLTGTGAIVLSEEKNWPGHTGISFAFGFIVFFMILLFGKTSGAHINPAVSIAFSLNGSLPVKNLFFYLFAQISGALAASLLLLYLFPGNEFLGATQPAGSSVESFILEIILTFLLMAGILLLIKFFPENILMISSVVGIIIFLEAYFAGPVTGASMNPARSIAPAIASSHLENLWIYIFAPVIGSVLAIFASKLLIQKK